MNRHIVSGVFAAVLLASTPVLATSTAPAPAVQADEAMKFVDSVGGQALATLQDENLKQSEKTAKLNALFSNVVDIEYIGKFVLGRHWRTATPQQQSDYLAAYKPFIIKSYVGRVARYGGQTYKITNSKPVEDGAIVGMVLHTPDGSEPDVTVNYRLNKTASGYKVIDILVEGVSLLNTQRSEFSSIVNNKGIDYLIEALKKKSGA